MADPYSSEEAARAARAAQNVMFQRQYGTGLDTQAAMQSPDYQLGSGSSLRQAPRRLGTRSGDMRREARRLRKQGYMAQAGQLAGAAAAQKLQEGSAIKSEAQRGIETGQRIQAGGLAQQQQELTEKYMDYTSRLLDKRMQDLEDKEQPTNGFEIQWGGKPYPASPSSGATSKDAVEIGTVPTSNQTPVSTLDQAQMETEGSGQLGGMLTVTGPEAPTAPTAPTALKPSLIDNKPASEVLAAFRDQRARESDPEGYARRQQRRKTIRQELNARLAKKADGGIEGYTMAELADDGGYEAKTVSSGQKAGYDAYFFDKKQAAAQAEKDKATRAQDAEIAKQRRRAEELMRGYSR